MLRDVTRQESYSVFTGVVLCDLTKDKACLPWFVIEDKGGMQCVVTVP